MKDFDPRANTPPQQTQSVASADSDSWRRIAHGTPLGRAPARPVGANSEDLRRRRFSVSLPVSFASIDPARDPASGELYYDTSEREVLVNISRRGACLCVERAPEDGTRLLLRLKPPGSTAPVDLVARTRWSRVEYLPGDHGARAIAMVGVEVIGGSSEALDRFEIGVDSLQEPSTLAAPEASG